MSYEKQQIKEGITLHTIETNKFKTNLLSVFLTMPLLRENVTKDALISSVLRRGTKTMPSIEEISIKLEEMYGASFDCGIDKIGEKHVLKFYLETINEEFLPQKENILKEGLNTIFDVVFNPLVENEKFKEEYVNGEKQKLRQIIDGKKDNKAKYALERTIEEMYTNKPYGLYKFGYIEDLEKINSSDLYNYYKEMISKCKIDIFVSGKIKKEEVKELVDKNENILKLQQRTIENEKVQFIESIQEPQTIKEKMDITQGKLVLGLTVQNDNNKEGKYITLLYNMLLGGGANSKLFQNVREKASLAYTASSNYVRQMNNIFIRCGIEASNYEKALEIINKQLKDLENGDFSEEDLQNAKQTITSTIKFIPDEQDTEITYYFGGEISNNFATLDEYEQKVTEVTREQIIDLAKKVKVHTIYFLANN